MINYPNLNFFSARRICIIESLKARNVYGDHPLYGKNDLKMSEAGKWQNIDVLSAIISMMKRRKE